MPRPRAPHAMPRPTGSEVETRWWGGAGPRSEPTFFFPHTTEPRTDRANVRDRDAFIGPGICKVFVTPPTNPEVQLRAQRCDGTWACLQVGRTWQGQGWQHALEFRGVHQHPGGPPS